ncbi:MAG: HlyC/CorC family transporter [Oscillospiraceae bacterium]|jgi:putative hemolysin|nr:HlyC/CorC family transporter [Oscillospiraceae bacterium]
MDSSSITMILAILFLVAFSAFFSATETAFTSLNRVRMKAKADAGDLRAGRTLRLAEDYDRLLTTILIGNNVVNISAATVSTALFTHLLGAYGPTVSTVVLTIVVLIFGEVSPKSLAMENAEGFALFATPFMRLLIFLFTPLAWLFAQWKRLLSKLFRPKDGEGITEEELVTMVEQAETEGGLDEHESELIRSAIEFGDMEVQEILTPRVDITAVEDSATMEEIASVFAESGYSRLPVYHEDMDDILGVIHEKDFHIARYRGQTDPTGLITPVLYTTGNTKISDLLRILQRKKAHMVVVVDEYGGTEGLCTLEDIVEELVGEIWDEHDEVIEEFKKQPDGSYLIACHAALSDLYDLFALTGECEANTVSGWVMEQVGRIPEEGDRFQSDGLDVTVTRVDHRRVLEIRVVVLEKEIQE